MDPQNKQIEQLMKKTFIFEGLKIEQKETQNDLRKVVPDSFKYPLSCIGMIISKYEYFDKENNKKSTIGKGTGCLISPIHILTCAHNCFNQQFGKPKNIKYYPAINKQNQKENSILVVEVKYDEKYEKTGKPEHDLASLRLEQAIGFKYGYLGIDLSTENILKTSELMMYGYSKWDEKQYKYEMLESAGICAEADRDFITYYQKTDKGQSGGPIITQKDGKFYTVGVHICCVKDQEDDTILQNRANRLTQEKLEMIKKWIGENENYHNFKQFYQTDLSWQSPEDVVQFMADSGKDQAIQELGLKCCLLNQQYLNKLHGQRYENIIKLDLSFNQISNKGISFLKSFPKLKRLNLFKNCLQRSAINGILDIHLPDIEVIDLGLNKIGDDNGVSKLYELEKLLILKISKIGISPAALQNLNIGYRLHTIQLSGNNLGEKTLLILLKWEKQLRQLDVSENKITDQGIKLIEDGNFPILRKLNLSDNRLTNSCTEFFPKLPLKWLYLTENPDLTMSGVQKIGYKLKLKQIRPSILC